MGRLGEYFGSVRYGYRPDIITVAKGLTSGYAPLGAMIVSDRLVEPFVAKGATFAHGLTFAGHPVSCAVAIANLDLFDRRVSSNMCALGRVRYVPSWKRSPTCQSSKMCEATDSCTRSSW